MYSMLRVAGLSALLLTSALTPVLAEAPVPAETAAAAQIDPAKISEAVKKEVGRIGVPSASVAVVVDGKLLTAVTAGKAGLTPDREATPAARYAIGSISKQFMAAAMLLLQEDGKLSLDDKASKYFPDLGPAGAVTIRQMLSHTSGLTDFWPQDYVFAQMQHDTTPQKIIDGWARRPLDFAPGDRWQYSNTGYVLAGMILEKVSGQTVFAFLQSRIFKPLAMTSVVNFDQGGLTKADAAGYTRYGLGPWHPALPEGKGWMFAAGGLAMTAGDLARWDLSIINQSLLKPQSYREFEREVVLNSGAGSRYGLGLGVSLSNERRVLSHGGEVSGFIADNTIYPDQRAAIVVLTNADANSAADAIGDKLKEIVFQGVSPADEASAKTARTIFDGLCGGKLDRALFSANANAYFTDAVLQEFAASLTVQGAVKSFKALRSGTRGGMDFRVYDVEMEKAKFQLVTRALPDGKLEQFMLFPK